MDKRRTCIARFEETASWAVMLLCFAMTAYYLIAGYGAYLDADMSSELALAQHLVKGKTLLSPTWYYSTEIRLLATQLVYTPLMALFPNDWQIVRTVGGLILMAALAGSCFFAARACGAKKRYARVFAGLIVLPVSPLYAEFIVVGTYYVPHAVLTLLALGLYARCMHPGRRQGATAAGLCLLAALMGMSSVRYMLCALIPLFGAALWQYVFAANEEETRTRKQNTALVIAFGAAACGGAGYLFSQKVLSRLLHWGNGYYSGVGYTSLAETDLFAKTQLVMKGLLDVLGYEDGAALFGVHGVLNALILLSIFVAALLIARLACGTRRADAQEKERARMAGLMLVIAAALTFGMFLLLSSMYVDRYWIPVVTLALPVLAAALSQERNRPLCLMATALLCTTMLLPAASCMKYSMRSPEYVTDQRMAAVEALQARGLTKGYSTFWVANIVTELSDGEIEVVAMEMATQDGETTLVPYRWLEAEENFAMDRPNEPVFVLLGNWEEAQLAPLMEKLGAVRTQLDGWIHLYEIPSQRLLFETLGLAGA